MSDNIKEAQILDEILNENDINYKSYILEKSSVFIFLDDGAELYSDKGNWYSVGMEPKYRDDKIIRDTIEDISDYILNRYKIEG